MNYLKTDETDYILSKGTWSEIKKYFKNSNRLGKGSGRDVYYIDDKTVIKIAKNKKGIEQNKVEIIISKSMKYSDVIAEVLDYSENGYFVIAKYASKLSDDSFRRMCSCDFDDFLYYIRFRRKWDGSSGASKLFNDIESMIREFDLDRFDIADCTSWGIINDSPVVIDYGMTLDLSRRLYGAAY